MEFLCPSSPGEDHGPSSNVEITTQKSQYNLKSKYIVILI